VIEQDDERFVDRPLPQQPLLVTILDDYNKTTTEPRELTRSLTSRRVTDESQVRWTMVVSLEDFGLGAVDDELKRRARGSAPSRCLPL
jgi:hypothetical protein